MAKKPYKYRQAKKDAKAAAKKAFPGKVKAVRKDITGKITAEDRLALKEMADTAKKELGKNAYLSRAEYDAMRNADLEKFRQSMADEFGEYGGKKAGGAEAPAKKASAKKAAVKKPAVKKAAVAKPTESAPVKKAAPSKKMTRAEKSAANKAAWAKMTPEERKNWKGTKPGGAEAKPATATESSTKPGVKKPSVKKKAAKKSSAKKTVSVTRPTDASLTAMEDEKLKQTKEKLIKEGKLSGSKELAIRPKGTVASTRTGTVATTTSRVTPIPGSDTVVKKKGGKLKKLGKFGVITAAIAAGLDAKNYVEGVKRQAQAEADLFYAKKGRDRNVGEKLADVATKGLPTAGKQLAKYFTMGLVGEDSSVGAARAEKALKKYKQAKIAKANKGLRYGPDGSSLVPGTDAYKKGSKTRPVNPIAPGAKGGTAGGTTGGAKGGAKGGASATPGAGGSTITATPGSTYIVKSGDTLSAIAKASGVSLAEIRKANKKFATNPKYKQGNMIWSGTKVNIPKK